MTSKRKNAHRFYDLNDFVDVSMQDLTRAEMAVWLSLFRSARDRTVRLSREQIAATSGCSVKATGQAIQSLIAKKLIRQTVRGSINRGPSTYRIRGSSEQYPPQST